MQKYTIGIDIGGTNTKIALIGNGCRIIARHEFLTKGCKNKNRLINAIANKVNGIIAQKRFKKSQIYGIGIGVPGLVDSKNGIVHTLTNIPGFKNVNLKRIFEHKTGIITFVDNDVNLMALAEAKFGAGKGVRHLFCITLGTGVGGGIIINGEVYRGSSYSAGEIGHIPISFDGPKCNCGSRGCLESYVGNTYILKGVKDRIKKGAKSILKDLVKGELNRITPQLITRAAKKNDKLARHIWKETAGYLGRGLVTIINVLNPEIIVLGGGMIGAGKFLFGPLRKYVKENAMSVPAGAVKIVRAKLGNDAGVIGAVELVRIANLTKMTLSLACRDYKPGQAKV